jgi:hypothetical protein
MVLKRRFNTDTWRGWQPENISSNLVAAKAEEQRESFRYISHSPFQSSEMPTEHGIITRELCINNIKHITQKQTD